MRLVVLKTHGLHMVGCKIINEETPSTAAAKNHMYD